MRTKEVKLKRYFPGEGMALKVTRRIFDCFRNEFIDSVSYTAEQGILIDENDFEQIEEVPLKEYKKWVENNNRILSFTGIC